MKYITIIFLVLFSLLLSSCLYDNAPSQPAAQINTALVGVWTAQDKNGKVFEVTVTPESNLLYHMSCCDKDKNGKDPWQFEGWISRIDKLKILTLCSLSADPRYHGKYIFFHYEVVAPGKPPIDNVAPKKMRITQLLLDESAHHLDPKLLRQAIRERLKQETLLPSEGSVVWTKVGNVTWKGEN